MDLLDLHRGALSWRKAALLAVNLPPGAATWRAAGVDGAWTDEAHLLATAVDVLRVANWQRSEGPKPEPVLRPAEARKEQDKKARIIARAEDFQRRQQQRP